MQIITGKTGNCQIKYEPLHFIGEPSGGYTTVTNWQPIDNELIMSISVTYYADRNNIVFEKALQPNERVEFVPELAHNRDLAIAAARNWLSRG